MVLMSYGFFQSAANHYCYTVGAIHWPCSRCAQQPQGDTGLCSTTATWFTVRETVAKLSSTSIFNILSERTSRQIYQHHVKLLRCCRVDRESSLDPKIGSHCLAPENRYAVNLRAFQLLFIYSLSRYLIQMSLLCFQVSGDCEYTS